MMFDSRFTIEFYYIGHRLHAEGHPKVFDLVIYIYDRYM